MQLPTDYQSEISKYNRFAQRREPVDYDNHENSVDVAIEQLVGKADDWEMYRGKNGSATGGGNWNSDDEEEAPQFNAKPAEPPEDEAVKDAKPAAAAVDTPTTGESESKSQGLGRYMDPYLQGRLGLDPEPAAPTDAATRRAVREEDNDQRRQANQVPTTTDDPNASKYYEIRRKYGVDEAYADARKERGWFANLMTPTRIKESEDRRKWLRAKSLDDATQREYGMYLSSQEPRGPKMMGFRGDGNDTIGVFDNGDARVIHKGKAEPKPKPEAQYLAPTKVGNRWWRPGVGETPGKWEAERVETSGPLRPGEDRPFIERPIEEPAESPYLRLKPEETAWDPSTGGTYTAPPGQAKPPRSAAGVRGPKEDEAEGKPKPAEMRTKDGRRVWVD